MGALLAAPLSAVAGGSSGGGVPPEWVHFQSMNPMDAMHMMDKDNKGYVTKEDFQRFQDEFFAKLDKRGDGKITADEWMGKPTGKNETKK
jgi:hypothetical protein